MAGKNMRICFEVSALDNGEPYTLGMQVSFDCTVNANDYENLAKSVDLDKLISGLRLDTLGVTKENVRVISLKEYDELYGGDEDG